MATCCSPGRGWCPVELALFPQQHRLLSSGPGSARKSLVDPGKVPVHFDDRPSATFSATGVGEPDMDGEGQVPGWALTWHAHRARGGGDRRHRCGRTQADGCVRVPSSGRLRCRAWNRAAKRSGSPSSTAWVRRPWLAIPEIDPCALAVSLLSLPGQLFVQFSEFLRKLEERMKMKFHLLVENVLLQTVAEVHGP